MIECKKISLQKSIKGKHSNIDNRDKNGKKGIFISIHSTFNIVANMFFTLPCNSESRHRLYNHNG